MADHVQKVMKPSFSASWEELGESNELEDTYALSMKTMEGETCVKSMVCSILHSPFVNAFLIMYHFLILSLLFQMPLVTSLCSLVCRRVNGVIRYQKGRVRTHCSSLEYIVVDMMYLSELNSLSTKER